MHRYLPLLTRVRGMAAIIAAGTSTTGYPASFRRSALPSPPIPDPGWYYGLC